MSSKLTTILISIKTLWTVYFKDVSTEIEEVIGCAQRGNVKYFLEKYKGMQEKTIIDWETAKNQPLIFIEFFGERLTWPPMLELIGPNDSTLNNAEDDDEENAYHDPNGGISGDEPNDIYWDI